MMMIHNPWTVAWGDANAFRQVADELDKIREAMIPVYETRTGLERDEIIKMLDAETWMTADEAVELGFADEIEEDKQVAASVSGSGRIIVNGVECDLSQYRNPPKVFVAPGEAPKEGPEANAETDEKVKLMKLELELLTGNS